MSAHPGHTVSLLNAMTRAIRVMERLSAVVAATTDVTDATGTLRTMRDIPMYSAVAEFAVELPSTDPSEIPCTPNWRTTNERDECRTSAEEIAGGHEGCYDCARRPVPSQRLA